MVTIIEGPRDVGKTFLLDQLYEEIYKFPFVDYIKNSYHLQNHYYENNDPTIHYFCAGLDLTILELSKQKILKNITTDRGFLSMLVFGVQSGRITYEQALIEGKYIKDNYKFRLVYITKETNEPDTRNKDEYSFYDFDTTNQLYLSLIKDLDLNCETFINKFDNKSIENFKTLIYKI